VPLSSCLAPTYGSLNVQQTANDIALIQQAGRQGKIVEVKGWPGYTDSDGTFAWYPEFDRPLGPPKGEAAHSGWIYSRELEHASVWVDLEHQSARIDWR
jgi:hypothetical protein